MSNKRIHRATPVLALLLWLFASQPSAAAELQQVIELRPGWNAIYVEVEPSEADIETVFAGLPVASVWRWIPGTGAEFIRDPAEGLQNVEGWFAWFPEPRPEAFLSNLFAISANTAYLVKLDGSSNRSLTLRGLPRLRPPQWQANAFTLTGLSVDPDSPPSFAEFFSASSAHQGQPMFELASDGRWREVVAPASTSIEPGRAYWIRTAGTSRYQGRMRVVLEAGDKVEYSGALSEARLVLRNLSGVNSSFLVERFGGDTMPLSFRNEDPETGEVAWPRLRNTLTLDAPSGEDVFLTLAVQRGEFTSERMDQILSIRDEHGQRVLLYVGGNTVQPVVLPTAAAKAAGAKATPLAYAGLWVGVVSVDAVSESQQGGAIPTPTGHAFEQRILLHVDSAGQARLLKDVIQMWEDGTTQPAASDPSLNEVETPGRYVLVTDKDLIGLFSGASNKDGASVGVRYSTVAYDFEGTELELDGDFGPGEQLNTQIVVTPELPTNPFLHRYHPDHDNLDAQFLNFRLEAYQVVRDLRLIFTEEDPQGRTPPGWGESIVGGLFEESITGLHKNTIFTSGEFRLRRISAVSVLNQ